MKTPQEKRMKPHLFYLLDPDLILTRVQCLLRPHSRAQSCHFFNWKRTMVYMYTCMMEQKIDNSHRQAMTTVRCGPPRAIGLEYSPPLRGRGISGHWVANLTMQPYSTLWWLIFRTPLLLWCIFSFSRLYVIIWMVSSPQRLISHKDRNHSPCCVTPRCCPLLLWPSWGQSLCSRRACSTDLLPFSTPRISYSLSLSTYIYTLSGTNHSGIGNGWSLVDKRWYGTRKIVL